jgi:nucleotide-binding universal stress UspA family protein
MFENILVAVDGSKHSDAAFDVGMDIAQKYGSQLYTPCFSRWEWVRYTCLPRL